MITQKILYIYIGLAFLTSGAAYGATIKVPDDYTTILEAIHVAVIKDIIEVADGTYKGTVNRDIDFNGKEITVQLKNGPEETIIDCENVGGGFDLHSDETDKSVIKGINITNGSADRDMGDVYTVCKPSGCNFTSIQAAVDTVPIGATIRVLAGNYTESVVINKSVKLIGDGKDSTILIIDDPDEVGFYVDHANYVTISKFGILCTHPDTWLSGSRGISVSNPYVDNNANYCEISENRIENTEYGIFLWASDENLISNNEIRNSRYPIYFNWDLWEPDGCDHNTIEYNKITGSKGPNIHFRASSYNTISNNRIYNDPEKIALFLYFSDYSSHNVVTGNFFKTNRGNVFGIQTGDHNEIYDNYFETKSNSYGGYDQTCTTRWNLESITPGKNIVGGPNLGGNAWDCRSDACYFTSYDCDDLNGDGICDNPLLGLGYSWCDPGYNSDEFPLKISDGDNDGIADIMEMGPNWDDPTYDGNSDGVPDNLQENNTSMPTNDGENYVTFASPDGTRIGSCQAIPNPSPDDAPADQEFPVGFFEFTIYGIEPGGITAVTLILPDGMTIETYYKFGPTPDNHTPHWYEFSYDSQTKTGAVINGSQVVLHLVDGQRGDNDISVNGIIVEPGSPAIEKIKACENDTDEDGDVDGADLATLINSGATDVDIFAEDFGRVNCP